MKNFIKFLLVFMSVSAVASEHSVDPKYIKSLVSQWLYNTCLEKHKTNPDKNFCKNEKDNNRFNDRMPDEAYNSLKIQLHQEEIKNIFDNYDGLIVLRDPRTSGNKTLVLGCGNEPVVAGKKIAKSTKGTHLESYGQNYAKAHAHVGADTLNTMAEYNPSMLGSVTNLSHTKYIPDNHYNEVYFEGLPLQAYRTPVFKEMHRILKIGGIIKIDPVPSIFFVEKIGQIKFFDEDGFVENWKGFQLPSNGKSPRKRFSAYESDGIGTFLLEQDPEYELTYSKDKYFKDIEKYFKTLGFTKTEFIKGVISENQDLYGLIVTK